MKLKFKKQYRSMTIAKEAIDADTRCVRFSFSSEIPYRREFGDEILSHELGACDLSRLKDGAAFLLNHDIEKQIGCVEEADIVDRKGQAVGRFGNSELANEIYKDVQDGIRRNVSVGYKIHKVKEIKDINGNTTGYEVTRWEPLELSIVSVPADQTIGVGRSDEDVAYEVEIEETRGEAHASKTELEVEQTSTIPVEVKNESFTKVKVMNDAEMKAALEAAKKEDAKRRSDIIEIGKRFGMVNEAMTAVAQDTSVEDFRKLVLDKAEADRKHVVVSPDIGMSAKEKKAFSIVRAISALVSGKWDSAGLEKEASEAHGKLMGKEARGFFIPNDVLTRADTQTVGTAGYGGNLVATNLMSGSFIDLLRNKTVTMSAGATTLTGLVGNVAIPRQTAGTTAYWVGESGTVTASRATFDQVPMSPKTVGALVDISRKLLSQSSPSIDALVLNDINQSLAIGIDAAAIAGTGEDNQPTGILLTSGIGSVLWGSGSSVTTPTFAKVVELESKLGTANALAGKPVYMTNYAYAGTLKTTVKVSGFPQYIMDKGEMNGYPVLVTNQVPASTVIFGDFSQLIIGLWSGLDVTLDTSTGSAGGSLRIVGLQDCDIAVRHATAFSKGIVDPA